MTWVDRACSHCTHACAHGVFACWNAMVRVSICVIWRACGAHSSRQQACLPCLLPCLLAVVATCSRSCWHIQCASAEC